MGQHDVTRGETGTEMSDDVKQSVVVGNKDLQEIAHFSQFGRCADKIRHGSGSAIPDKNVKTLPTQNLPHTVADNPKANYADISFCSAGHFIYYLPISSERLFSLKENAAARNPEIYVISFP
jgi:hypothetical protein